MDKEKLYEEIYEAIVELEDDKIGDLTQEVIINKLDILDAINKAYTPAIRKLGEMFDEGEYFLPELMMGGQMAQTEISKLLDNLPKDQKRVSKGKVVMATIEGDIHSIGKNIVATMLSAYGYEVFDVGADVPAEKIIESAENNNADIIGVSALLTTTMPGQKKVVDMLVEKGVRDKYKVILGGAPVSQEWVNKCKADGYAPSANEAVKLVDSFMKK